MNWKRELKITLKQYNESVLPTRIRSTQGNVMNLLMDL